MKSVLISIRPKYCELIASGKKTVEVRKTIPKLEPPFKCYIYCTKERMPIKENGNIVMYEDDLALTNRYGQGKRVENPNGTMLNGEVFLNSKVIGEFVCDYIYENMAYDCEGSCVSVSDLKKYANGKPLYGWHISDLKIYDKPKDLSGFCKNGMLLYDDWLYGIYNGRDCSSYEKYKNAFRLSRPPQSWCYARR